MGEIHSASKRYRWHLVVVIALLLSVLFSFLVSLELMGVAFHTMGKDLAQQIVSATSNPFVGLFIGLLSTAIVQSSSMITSMVVTIVASGNLSLQHAVPLIMGANIGTTITSTIVAFGHISIRKEFRKAIAIGTSHDFFNILVTIILLPLEFYFGLLSRLAEWISDRVATNGTSFSFVRITVKPIAELLSQWLGQNVIFVLVLSVVLLFVSIKYFSVLLKDLLIGKSQRDLERYLFGNPIQALFFGIILTGSLRSSSLTTSLIVPLVATDQVSLKKAFPFVMGANIGTTITALIASIARPNAALSIALVHVLFNVIGVLIFFPFPVIRNIPVELGRALGGLAIKHRLTGFAYVLFTFFLIPFFLIYFTGPRFKTSVKAAHDQLPPASKKDTL